MKATNSQEICDHIYIYNWILRRSTQLKNISYLIAMYFLIIKKSILSLFTKFISSLIENKNVYVNYVGCFLHFAVFIRDTNY